MFNVFLKLFFVWFDDSQNKFKVYLDEDGNIPEIELDKDNKIENYIFTQASKYFYGPVQNLLNSCKLSNIEKVDEKIDITYNIYCYDNLNCKVGKFVNFDKNSIELYRFAKNRGFNE